MALQYIGWVKVDGVAVPVTSSNLLKQVSPIWGDNLIHGGHTAEASMIHYADGQNKYSGDIAFPMFYDLFDTLKAWAITNRGAVDIIQYDAQETFTYDDCYCTSWRLNGNAGGLIDSTITVEALGRTASGAAPTFNSTFESSGGVNKSPIPYWKSTFEIAAGSHGTMAISTDDITSWSLSISINADTLYTFNQTQDPKDIQMGLIDVTGDFSVYDETLLTAGIADGSEITVTLCADKTLIIPYAVLTSPYQLPISGPNSRPIRSIGFRGLGDNSHNAVY